MWWAELFEVIKKMRVTIRQTDMPAMGTTIPEEDDHDADHDDDGDDDCDEQEEKE